MLNKNDVICIKDAQDYITKPGLKNNLTYIKFNFAKLFNYISYRKCTTTEYNINNFN